MQYPDFAALCDEAYSLIEAHQRTGHAAALLRAKQIADRIEEATALIEKLLASYGDRLPPAEAAGFLGAMHLMRDVVTKLHLYFSAVQ